MKRLLVLALGLTLLTTGLFAQDEETVFGYSGLKLTGAWGGPMMGMTKLGDDYAYYRGGFGGLEFNNSLFVGWGGASLRDEVRLDNFPDQDFSMRYSGLMLAYDIKANKAVHPRIALLGGGGEIEFDEEGKDRVFVIQPSVGLEVNIFRWWHVAVEGGYRFVTNTDIAGITDTDLSAPYAEVKFRFGFSWGW